MEKIPENEVSEFNSDNSPENNPILEEDIMAEKMVEIINIFHIYYKILFKKEKNVTMFEGMNLEDNTSTNRSMELLFEHIYKYKDNISKNKLELIEIYNEDDSELLNLETDELFALLINNDINKLSPSLFSIISHLANNFEWREINWKIINLKEN